jgi:class 3 adenylate cyclase
MDTPVTRYAKSGEFDIAYQVIGDGPVDLVFVPGWITHLDLQWEEPSLARFLGRLASFSRLIVFDKRGIGLSDRVSADRMPTMEERMDDVRAVLDAVGADRAAVFCQGYGAPIGTLFAATYPERVASLVLYEPSARGAIRTDDYPWGGTREEHEAWLDASANWGSDEFAAQWLRRLAPSVADDPKTVAWTARMLRAAASPSTSRSFSVMNALMDVRIVLPLVRVSTLVLAREDAFLPKGAIDFPPQEEARWVAGRIPDAKYVVVPGRDYLPWVGDQDSLVAEIEEFVTGRRRQREFDRQLLTVLFTDIVGSTSRAAELGDRRWRELLEEHNTTIRRSLERFQGKEIDRAGDGFLATFDGPARAIRCALDIVDRLERLGVDVRAGIHAGEVELIDSGIGGIAVHIGARVAAAAAPGEVLVTSTVADLVAGSGIEFGERGIQELKGVPGEWHLLVAAGDSSGPL